MASEAQLAGSAAVAGRSAAGRVAWSLVAVGLALGAVGLIMSLSAGESSSGHGVFLDILWIPILVAWAIVGALIASRQPRNPIGWILCGLTLFAALTSLAEGTIDLRVGASEADSWTEAGAWLENWTWIPLVFVPLASVPVYFPDGRLPSRRWRIVPWCAGVGTAGFAFSEAFAAGPLSGSPDIVNPYGIDSVAVDIAGFGFLLGAGALLAGVASLVVRFRRAEGIERQQIKWLAYAGSFAATTLVAGGPVSIWSEPLANALILVGVLSIPVAIGIAILRYRLYDIDLLINRTLVYGGLTAAVVGIYVVLVGGLSEVFHERAGFWSALVATGLAAVLVQPLRSGLQRRVNRVMYGPGGYDQAAPSGLRGHLQEAFVPETAALQRARERLVAAREEERRRLRRDLHDGLGPALAGAALKVEAAGNMLGSSPGEAARLLEDARSGLQGAVADVRRLVYALRPPALDELGLVEAVREQGERLGGGDQIQVDVDGPDELNGLPAAVEVAAYRIALEAMTNATRHSDAHRCVVSIAVDGVLELDISDDGHGLPNDFRAGVGIASMQERAEELGGTCEIERVDGGGTRVRARLPLGSA